MAPYTNMTNFHLCFAVYVLILTLTSPDTHILFKTKETVRKDPATICTFKKSAILPRNYMDVSDLTSYATNILFSRNTFIKTISSTNARNLIWIHALLLVLGGDINPNTGPTPISEHDNCGICKNIVGFHPDRGIKCDNCDIWYHVNCMGMTTEIYEALGNSSMTWICDNCGLPTFTDSFFDFMGLPIHPNPCNTSTDHYSLILYISHSYIYANQTTCWNPTLPWSPLKAREPASLQFE